MLTASEFATVLSYTGVTVEVHQTKPPKKVYNIKAIPQSVSKSGKGHEALVQAYGINGMTFQFAAVDHIPERLDQIVMPSGERYTVDSVVKHVERGTGNITSTTCYCKGR